MTSPRKLLNQRKEYKASHPQEEFIVSILKKEIEKCIEVYFSPDTPNHRVLDAGCGNQPFRAVLENLGYSYESLDVQQNLDNSVDYECPIDVPLPQNLIPQKYNYILCTELLEHVANWETAFNNLADLTFQGSRLIITVPFFYPLHEEPYDFWRPTSYALDNYAARAGFKIIYQNKAGTSWDILGTLLASSWLRRKKPGLLGYIGYYLIALNYKFTLKLLLKRKLQEYVDLNSNNYISNICVLERL